MLAPVYFFFGKIDTTRILKKWGRKENDTLSKIVSHEPCKETSVLNPVENPQLSRLSDLRKTGSRHSINRRANSHRDKCVHMCQRPKTNAGRLCSRFPISEHATPAAKGDPSRA